MESQAEFGDRLASLRKTSSVKPAIYRPPKRSYLKCTSDASPKTWRSSRNGMIKTIDKARKQSSISVSRRKKSASDSQKIAWEHLRVAHRTKYDFKLALLDRNTDRSKINENILSNAHILYKEHKWTKPFVPLNILLDVEDMDYAREVLKLAEKQDRNIFGRGKVGLDGRALTDLEKIANHNKVCVKAAEKAKLENQTAINTKIRSTDLEKLRSKLQKSLDKLENIQSLKKGEKISDSMKMSLLKEKTNVKRFRQELIAATLRSSSFLERREVDLHGLSVKDAIKLVTEALKASKFDKDLTVIHGKGNNSKAGVSMIAVNLTKFLADAGINFLPDENNRGRLVIKPEGFVASKAFV